VTLQNHPGETEYPVRPRARYARAADARRRQPGGGNQRRALLLTAWGLPLGVVGFITGRSEFQGAAEETLPFFTGAVCFGIGLLIASIVFQQIDSRGPRDQQRAYIAAAGLVPVSQRQQQLLALDSSSDWSFGCWNSSLAYMPTWAELPADLRQKYGDGAQGSPWPALPLGRLDEQRAALDSRFRIASADDLELLVADTLIVGSLSQRFAEVATSDDAERMFSRVSAITGETEFRLIERTHPTADAEPLLLLAGDTERTIGAVRFSYLAGYLTADRAWELIGRLGDRAFARYPDYDAYWADVAVAVAFASDSLQQVQDQRALRVAVTGSNWPAARVPYPAASQPVVAG